MKRDSRLRKSQLNLLRIRLRKRKRKITKLSNLRFTTKTWPISLIIQCSHQIYLSIMAPNKMAVEGPLANENLFRTNHSLSRNFSIEKPSRRRKSSMSLRIDLLTLLQLLLERSIKMRTKRRINKSRQFSHSTRFDHFWMAMVVWWYTSTSVHPIKRRNSLKKSSSRESKTKIFKVLMGTLSVFKECWRDSSKTVNLSTMVES